MSTSIRTSRDRATIAALRRKMAALSKNEKLYRQLVEHAGESIACIDIEGRLLYVNRAGAREIGRTQGDITGRTLWDIFPKAYADRHNTAIRHAINNRTKQVVFEAPTFLQGKTTWHHTSIKPIFPGSRYGKPFVLMVARNITDKHHATEKLNATVSQLRELNTIINLSPAVVSKMSMNDSLPFVFVSDNVRKFGYDPQSLLAGKYSTKKMIHPDDWSRLKKELGEHILTGNDNFVVTYRLITSSGQIRWVEEYTQLLHDERGAVTHAQGVMFDITDRYLLSSQLKTSQHALSVELQKRSQLAQDLHDRIIQSLYGVGLRLDDCCHRTAEEWQATEWELHSLIEELNTTIREIRGFISTPGTSAKNTICVYTRLQQQVDRVRHMGVVKIAASINAVACGRIPREMAEDILAISQEALSNSVRHANARHLTFHLRQTNTFIQLYIHVDGRGLPLESSSPGDGLLNIRTRARAIGARLRITSSAVRGTTIDLRIPIKSSHIPMADKKRAMSRKLNPLGRTINAC